MRRSSGFSALRSAIAVCNSTAQHRALTTLGNSSSRPSPVVLTMRPPWPAIAGSTTPGEGVLAPPACGFRRVPLAARTGNVCGTDCHQFALRSRQRHSPRIVTESVGYCAGRSTKAIARVTFSTKKKPRRSRRGEGHKEVRKGTIWLQQFGSRTLPQVSTVERNR